MISNESRVLWSLMGDKSHEGAASPKEIAGMAYVYPHERPMQCERR
jgi:hypothetical protein